MEFRYMHHGKYNAIYIRLFGHTWVTSWQVTQFRQPVECTGGEVSSISCNSYIYRGRRVEGGQ